MKPIHYKLGGHAFHSFSEVKVSRKVLELLTKKDTRHCFNKLITTQLSSFYIWS
jgi:hypothetical protein